MTTESRLTMPLGEAIFTQRAIRRFKPDPIPDEDLRHILESAIRAPSGGNRQPWHFVVVRDSNLRAEFAPLYHESYFLNTWRGPSRTKSDYISQQPLTARSEYEPKPLRLHRLRLENLRHWKSVF